GRHWVQTVTDDTKLDHGKLSGLRLCGFHHRELVFAAGGTGPVSTILGLEYLVRYVMTFDFPHNSLYLHPASHFHDRVIWDLRYEPVWIGFPEVGCSLGYSHVTYPRGEIMAQKIEGGTGKREHPDPPPATHP